MKIKHLIKEKFIISKNKKIHLDIYDNDQKKDATVIFIHGTSVYSRFYAEFCYKLFEKGYRVIAPDMIGHGLSEGVRGHFTIKGLSEIIYDINTHVMKKYGGKVILMGSSLGGITTLYSTAFDERVSGAICHNAAIFNEKAYKKIIKQKGILKFLVKIVPTLVKIFPKMKLSVFTYLNFEKLANRDFKGKIEYLLNDPLLTDKYTLTSLNAQLQESLAKPVEKVKTPIMIINGDNDYLFSIDYMKEIYDRLTCENKKLSILEGASHLIFQEHIDKAIEDSLPWLKMILSL